MFHKNGKCCEYLNDLDILFHGLFLPPITKNPIWSIQIVLYQNKTAQTVLSLMNCHNIFFIFLKLKLDT